MFLHLPPAVRINPVQSWPSSACGFSRPDRPPLVLSLQQFNQVFLVEPSWAGIQNVALSADEVCTGALGRSELGHGAGHTIAWDTLRTELPPLSCHRGTVSEPKLLEQQMGERYCEEFGETSGLRILAHSI